MSSYEEKQLFTSEFVVKAETSAQHKMLNSKIYVVITVFTCLTTRFLFSRCMEILPHYVTHSLRDDWLIF